MRNVFLDRKLWLWIACALCWGCEEDCACRFDAAALSPSGDHHAEESGVSGDSARADQDADRESLGCPTVNVVPGGHAGTGWVTRYWDCCRPHCSWADRGEKQLARMCGTDGTTILTDNSTPSVCEGGQAGVCTSQVPWSIDGCDAFAFAFAAVPAADGGACGKCFLLTFTGEGKYETRANHQALQGKKLIVMASNVGSDVSQGQFDLMIPGGGTGYYNGCGAMNIATPGQQYGGLLSDCETSVGYSDGTDYLAARKACLTQACQQYYTGELLAGCLFLAEWLEAAGNPMHTYQEIECPSELTAKY